MQKGAGRFAGVVVTTCLAVACQASVIGPISGSDTVTVTWDTELHGIAAPGGKIAVKSGTLSILSNCLENVSISPGATNGLSLWLDATKNVFVDENVGGIVQWLDAREPGVTSLFDVEAREASGGFIYKRAKTHISDSSYGASAPVLTAFDGIGGRCAVDFGNYMDDSRWMYFTEGDGSSVKRIRVGSFLAVLAFHSKVGFLLDDVNSLESSGGTVFFHKETASGSAGSIGKFAPDNESCFAYGETRLNGKRVNPSTAGFSIGEQFQLFSQVGPSVAKNGSDGTGRSQDAYGNPFASVLFNDRNYNSENSGYARQGGGIIAELLIYDHVLSELERREVEAYLAAKWFGVSVAGRVAIADDAAMSVGSESSNDVVVIDVQDSGAIIKSGSGNLVVDGGYSLSDTRLVVDGGSVEFMRKREFPLVAPVPGTRLSLTNGVIAASSIPGTDFCVDGYGEYPGVVLHPVDLAGQKIVLSGVSARISPSVTAIPAEDEVYADAFPSNLISNGSFEDSTGNLATSAPDGFWFKESGISGTPKVAEYGGPWRSDTTFKVDGNNILALQVNGSTDAKASQYFIAPTGGIFRLSLWLARRESRSESEGTLKAHLLLDDNVFYANSNRADWRGDRNVFRKFEVELPISAGRHKLSIVSPYDGVETDRALIVDDIRLFLVRAGEFVPIANPGFESYEGAKTSQDQNGWYAKLSSSSPSYVGWTFSAVECGITQCDSTWWNHALSFEGDATADYRKAYLRNGGYIAQQVSFPRNGHVRFTMRFSNRCNGSNSGVLDGNMRNVGHHLDVSIGGNVFGSAYPLSQRQYSFSAEADVVAGVQELKVANVGAANGDYDAVIDDVCIEYVAPVSNGVIANGASADLTVTIPSDGFYALSLPLAGKVAEIGSTNVCNGHLYYPAATRISIDGSRIADAVVESGEFENMVFRLPRLESGLHTLTISGLGSGSGSLAVRRVGAPCIIPMEMESLPADCVKNVNVVVLEGTKLDLQYSGTLRVKGRVSLGGKTAAGIISAQSHPNWIDGPGALEVIPHGFVISFR